MALQWTTEEHTLSNIKKGIADGWRMNEQQLYEYGRKLLRARERLFPGELGNAFAETVIRSAKDRSEISWPGLSKDVETIQKLLQGGMEWSREEWLVRLPLLERRRETCFYTVLGDAFIQTLKRKLGLCEAAQRTQISSENNRKQTACDNIICETVQRTQISSENNRKQTVCDDIICETVQRTQIPSENNRKQTVCDDTLRLEELASWLMETDCKQTEAGKKPFRYFGKLTDAAAVVLAGLSLCFLSIWLYGRFEGNQNFYDIQKLKAVSADRQEALTENDSEIEKTAAEDQKEQDADDYSAPQTAANRGKTRIAGTAAGKQETADVSKKKKRPQILPQYREMAKEYPGLFGWLRIPDTRIDLPVMQPLKEKDFYLDHDFTGAASAEGALFADPENNRWPQDGNTVIYGHNMKNGHVFGTLDLYEDPAYFKAHREIHFDTIYETGIYEAVAVVKTRIRNENEQGFRYYQFFQYDNQEQFLQCADFVNANQMFDTGSRLRYGDQILMLSTCEYSQENGRLVIVARKAGDMESQENF